MQTYRQVLTRYFIQRVPRLSLSLSLSIYLSPFFLLFFLSLLPPALLLPPSTVTTDFWNEAYIPPRTRLATHFGQCWEFIDGKKRYIPCLSSGKIYPQFKPNHTRFRARNYRRFHPAFLPSARQGSCRRRPRKTYLTPPSPPSLPTLVNFWKSLMTHDMNDMIWHEWHDLTWITWFDMNDMIWHEWHDLTCMT
jgi:hypothetical protein